MERLNDRSYCFRMISSALDAIHRIDAANIDTSTERRLREQQEEIDLLRSQADR